MLDPIDIDFAVRGMRDVDRAFESVEQRVKRLERQSTQTSERESKTRVRTSQTEAKEREKAIAKLAKDAERWEKQRTREAAREEKLRERNASTAMKAVAREAQRTADAEIKEARRAAREIERIEEQKTRARIRSAEIAARSARSSARSVGGIVNRSVGGLISGAGSMAAATLGIGGGFMLADVARQRMAAGRAAVQVSNAAFIEGDAQRGKRVDPGSILKLATTAGIATATDKTELLQGLHTYVNLASDLTGMTTVKKSTGRTNLEDLSRMAKGEGADIQQVMSAAGYLRAQNPGMNDETMMSTMRNLIGAGKKGDISLADMAQHVGEIGGAASAFSGDMTANQGKLLGLAQIAGRVADPAEAATAVRRFSSDIGEHQKKLEAHGVHVTEKDGRLTDPAAILEQLFAKSGGNAAKLHELGLGERSIKVAQGLSGTYFAAENAKKGTGAKAVGDEVRSFESLVQTQGAVDQNFANVMNEPAEKFAQAMERLKDTMATKLEPWIEKFADKLPELVPKIERVIDAVGGFADWFADNPIKGIGAIVLASVTKDLAAAGIGAGVKAALSALIGGMGGGGVTVPGGGTGGGTVGKVLAVAAAATAAAEIAKYDVDSSIDSATGHQKTAIASGNEAMNAASALRNGKNSPEAIAAAKKQAETLAAVAEEQKKAIGSSPMGAAQTAVTGVMAAFGSKDAKELQQLNYDNQVSQYKQTKQALDSLTTAIIASEKALQAHTVTATNTDPKNPARSQPVAPRPAL